MFGALKALPFREIWAVDFEFVAPPGEQPDPVCMVARELRSGRLLKLWRQELRELGAAPFDTGSGSLFVAYFASAEIGCFLALGWPVPERILDLFTEFRAEMNGTQLSPAIVLLARLPTLAYRPLAAKTNKACANW